MKTYQDLKQCTSFENLKSFIISAIERHKATEEYRDAVIGQEYYRNENTTITKYEKVLYDMMGKAHKDEWTANHKIASNFFNFAITQQINYLLGNGVSFTNENTKETLGFDFDRKIHLLGKYALIEGTSFGFWNLDHLEIFKLTEFVPLYDEENGALRSGIRFWQVDKNKPLRITLYEEDGYSDYVRKIDNDGNFVFEILKDKTPYKLNLAVSTFDGTEILNGENYPTFPIVPLFANDNKQSELKGKRAEIDALDLLTSGLINNIDDGNLIYWVIQNAGGMTDIDDAKFIERLKTTHITHLEDDGATAEAHTIDVPYNASETAINIIKDRLYTDFMCFNVDNVSSGSKTATEINARYQLLDNKCDGFEYELIDFINGLFKIIGIEDKPTFTRSKIINTTEELQSILSATQYLDSETITTRILELLGMGDKKEIVLDRLVNEESNRFDLGE